MQTQLLPSPIPTKRFMPINAGPIVKINPRIPFMLNGPFPSPSSGSFVIRREKVFEKIPDIFTTCPDLKKMHNAFISAGIPDFGQPVTPIPNSMPLFQMTSPSVLFNPNAVVINPQKLGFVPKKEWGPQLYSLNTLRSLFFTKRNGYGRLFPFKLYHALLITKEFPEAYQYVGVKWVSENIIKVNGSIFANLLGIRYVSGGLFHRQGNFSRHHYMQVLKNDHPELADSPDILDVDDLTIMLFVDQQNRFTRDTEYNPLPNEAAERN